MTYLLMASCIGIFGYMHWLADATHIDVNRLLYMGGISKAVLGHGIDSYVRFISAGFLHGGLIHLLMNMYALWIIGSKCELYYGKAWFLVIYIISILGSSYFSVTFHETTTWSVGASGGIMGLFAADMCLNKYFNPHRSWFSQDTIFVLALNLIPGIIPNVDYWAHLGGAMTGLVVGFVVTKIIWQAFSISAVKTLGAFLAVITVGVLGYTAANIAEQYEVALDHLQQGSAVSLGDIALTTQDFSAAQKASENP
jgi:membrane associated rhomboid family serine protease